MKTALIVLGLAAYSQAKFCPGEKNGNKCVAGDNSYKCAVFFENLTSKRPLTWIGALPDALKKAKSPEEVQDILGADVTEESFSQLTSCDASTANARCYSILNDQKDIKLDSCDRNLINTGGSTTVGDYLCGQVRRWLRNSASFKSGGIRNRVVMNFIILGLLDGLILKKTFFSIWPMARIIHFDKVQSSDF